MLRREEQKIDPLSNELFIKAVYAPEKPKVKEKEPSDDEEEEEENEEEGGNAEEMTSQHDEELDDDLVNTYICTHTCVRMHTHNQPYLYIYFCCTMYTTFPG